MTISDAASDKSRFYKSNSISLTLNETVKTLSISYKEKKIHVNPFARVGVCHFGRMNGSRSVESTERNEREDEYIITSCYPCNIQGKFIMIVRIHTLRAQDDPHNTVSHYSFKSKSVLYCFDLALPEITAA